MTEDSCACSETDVLVERIDLERRRCCFEERMTTRQTDGIAAAWVAGGGGLSRAAGAGRMSSPVAETVAHCRR